MASLAQTIRIYYEIRGKPFAVKKKAHIHRRDKHQWKSLGTHKWSRKKKFFVAFLGNNPFVGTGEKEKGIIDNSTSCNREFKIKITNNNKHGIPRMCREREIVIWCVIPWLRESEAETDAVGSGRNFHHKEVECMFQVACSMAMYSTQRWIWKIVRLLFLENDDDDGINISIDSDMVPWSMESFGRTCESRKIFQKQVSWWRKFPKSPYHRSRAMIELLINDFACSIVGFWRTILIHRFQWMSCETMVAVAGGALAWRLAATWRVYEVCVVFSEKWKWA